MIVLGRVEGLERIELVTIGVGIDAGRVELGDIGLATCRSSSVAVKIVRAVLRAVVRALMVQLRRVVRDREEDPQDARRRRSPAGRR